MKGSFQLDPAVHRLLKEGTVIPAHPLALHSSRHIDERRQRALTRYYMTSGAGGIAVGVHTTQFAIRDRNINLLKPVLELASEEMNKAQLDRPFIKVAGICGPLEQALDEAKLAVALGYDLGLLSMGGLDNHSEEMLLERTRKVAEIIPVFGFYLQPSVGGRLLSFDFWKEFADITGVMAIKVAPFNRYQTLDVVRAVCTSERRDEISLYTGNDDNIVADLLTEYRFKVNGKQMNKRIVGGLLGHWAVWTQKAVELLDKIKETRHSGGIVLEEWLTVGAQITDANAALFDPRNNYKGCIPGIHEVLRRQGLLEGIWCLDTEETLSPGQLEEIDRVYREYPHLNDDEFVRLNLAKWLSNN